jgi:hypothetical protein
VRLPSPKVKASSELAGEQGSVERYEQLRGCALDGAPEGGRMGLALLQRRGIVAWMAAWQGTTLTPAARTASEPPAGSREIVGVLATMALACLPRE